MNRNKYWPQFEGWADTADKGCASEGEIYYILWSINSVIHISLTLCFDLTASYLIAETVAHVEFLFVCFLTGYNKKLFNLCTISLCAEFTPQFNRLYNKKLSSL